MKIPAKLLVSVALTALSVSAFAHNSRIRENKLCFVQDAFHGQRVSIRHEVDLDEECSKFIPMFDLECTEELALELPDAAECVTGQKEDFVEAPKLTQAGRQVRTITRFSSNSVGNRECAVLSRPARLNCVRWNPRGGSLPEGAGPSGR